MTAECALVVVTTIYTLATIAISYFNWKTSNTANKQMDAMEKQQKQNAGLAKYTFMKDALETVRAIPAGSFDHYRCGRIDTDIKLLFDDNVWDAYNAIKERSGEATGITTEEFLSELRSKDSELASQIATYEKQIHDGYEEQIKEKYNAACIQAKIAFRGAELSYKEAKDMQAKRALTDEDFKKRLIDAMESFIADSIK